MKIGSSRTRTYLLIAILVVAAILRFNHINQPLTDAFSWRQTSTAMMADNYYRRNWNIFYPEISWNGPGPSYNGREFQTVSYIAALLYVLVGQHDWVGRGVAVTFGLWGIFALYQLVRRVWDEEHAIVSAAVMALLLGQKNLKYMYHPYAHESHQMGLALRQAAQPGELVVTMANALGDPVAIYYSQRRGWVFPPPLARSGMG